MVTYNPDINLLKKSLLSIVEDVDAIIVVNNGKNNLNILLKEFSPKLSCYNMGFNSGIGAAQNFGIKKAKELLDFDYFLLSDQDSIYPNDYCNQLIPYFNSHEYVVAVCPNWCDISQNINGKSNLNLKGFSVIRDNKISQDYGKDLVEDVLHAISSGTIIDAKKMLKVGLMNEEYFIDWVDNEWCWRANSLGFKILGVPSIVLKHKMGDRNISLFSLSYTIRNSIRDYYIVRNALDLFLRSKFLNKPIKFFLFKKLLRHSLLSVLFSDNKIFAFKCIYFAYKDALRKSFGIFRH